MASWPTPDVPNGGRSTTGDPSNPSKKQIKLHHAVKHGPLAPASSSTDGSRRGLWATPAAWQQEESLASWERRKQQNLARHNNGNGMGTPLDMQVKQWATPRSGKTTDENPETWAKRQAKGDVATMPLTAQVKAWATPKASDPQHSGPNMRDSAGNYALPAQAVREQWGTPTARDHKSGRGNQDREYKELTPMVERQQAGKLNPRWVETLMGLPVGWTMPSCVSPVTIEPTSCDCSEMELSPQPQSELFAC